MNSLNHQLVVTGSHSDADAVAMETIPPLGALSVSARKHPSSIITVIPQITQSQHGSEQVQKQGIQRLYPAFRRILVAFGIFSTYFCSLPAVY